ncbi:MULTISPECIES: NAD-dependent succinate-semialdehyde dehydrogenase [Subtercola]|uniref:NAD-dependent succinate-semialdehyde dehydrogenase n=1 Tax=Subtercola vilae TaxID=2056433 RepID=A0A4T2CAU8_9MICO|nr:MULTISPECIES: NAD-dependent succinate-semialdehyde dehydrogenase [Subtercola]MEA9984862.1 NAD-dependent succinate-semialdehyde dehydrogenase [Subtercola sp. RTI3]TIH39886.1 NAD-dependent succinate-semialdehyde dehydrogenase [Subtercola vilae]
MSIYSVVNPATAETGVEYPLISDSDLVGAIERADTVHRQWSRPSSIADRAALVARVAELHTERRQQLAETAVREMGKPLDQALAEVDFSAEIYAYYAENAEQFLQDEPISLRGGAGSALVRRSSLGVLLGIMPWNFPLYQVARFAGPNLIVGNTILLKHAPQCPETAIALEQLFLDAGFPANAYTNLFASNEQIETVIADPRVQGVSLTGSERAGAAVAEIAGRNLTKVVLELGGSDPFILLSTDDLDGAVEAAVAARLDNNGQSCNAAKRFIVADDLYESFLGKFVTALSAVQPQNPTDETTKLGPLSSTAAADRLAEQLERAVQAGAVIAGPHERNGTFFSPAVLTSITPENPAYREEFFGPVAAVYRAADEDDAVRVANDTPFGLGSYVFTTDEAQALRVADRLDAGMVFVNTVLADSPELPFGGVKRSGFGRELGRLGAEEFVNKKLIRIG